MHETSKSFLRRMHDIRFVHTYFVGKGIDIGAGPDPVSVYAEKFPLMTGVDIWDLPQGDAQYMQTVADNTYDFVHSSHCLEHMHDPYVAFENWIRICKPGGHIITTIPEEDLYEQGSWPSIYNGDHKTTWTILKHQSWSPVSINVIEFLYQFKETIQVLKIERLDQAFVYSKQRIDQTLHGFSESAIEFIVKKLPTVDNK
jgi:SAM-dependent methyltransferase